jgi:hypothetical protein
MDKTTIPTGSYLVACMILAGHISRSSSACIFQMKSTAAESTPPSPRAPTADRRQSEHVRGTHRADRLLHLLEHEPAAFHLLGLTLELLTEQLTGGTAQLAETAWKTAVIEIAATTKDAAESHDLHPLGGLRRS